MFKGPFTCQPLEGGGRVSQKLTMADKGGVGLKIFQHRDIMGPKNVDREGNWFRFNHTC